MKILLWRLLIIFFIAGTVQPSDLESRIKMIVDSQNDEYLKGYMEPFATATGSISNGAMYHRAYTKSLLHFDIGVSAVYLQVPEKAKFIPGDGQENPTVFGTNREAGTTIPGTGVSSLLVPLFQANIGFISNLELTVRYADFNLSKFGQLSVIGGGVKYGLADMIPIPLFPLDFSVLVMWHSISVENWLSSGNLGMNILASSSFSVIPIDLYTGVGYDNTWIEISPGKIPDIGDSFPGSVLINGQNKFRATFGMGYTMNIINAHFDYNIGYYNSFGMGLMIVF